MVLGATPEGERVGLDCRMIALRESHDEEKWPFEKWWTHPETQSGLADAKRTSDWCFQARERI